VLLSLPGAAELRVRGRRPSLPVGLRLYAIGDIHGRLDLLDKLLARIDTDIACHPAVKPIYVFLGRLYRSRILVAPNHRSIDRARRNA
jgi:hypothetical protein